MKTRLHANATTTPRTRALIQASDEPVAALARRFGVSETTIRRWRARRGDGGAGEVQDRSHARHRLGQATTPEDEAIIAELRSRAGLSLDDIVEVMNRCVHPGLSRNSVWRALRRAGLSGRSVGQAWGGPRGAQSPRHAPFEEAPFGFVHVDLMYLGKLKGVAEFLFVAIERATRFAHVEVLPDRRAATVAAAWLRFLDAFGHPVHTVLTDNGAEFTDRFRTGSRDGHAARPSGQHTFDRICTARGIAHRLTRPYRPQTNGMVERFNRRVGEAMRALPQARDNSRHRTRFASHAEREAFILAFVRDYNRTRLRCLGYRAPAECRDNLTGHNTRGAHACHRQRVGGKAQRHQHIEQARRDQSGRELGLRCCQMDGCATPGRPPQPVSRKRQPRKRRQGGQRHRLQPQRRRHARILGQCDNSRLHRQRGQQGAEPGHVAPLPQQKQQQEGEDRPGDDRQGQGGPPCAIRPSADAGKRLPVQEPVAQLLEPVTGRTRTL